MVTSIASKHETKQLNHCLCVKLDGSYQFTSYIVHNVDALSVKERHR